MISAFLIYLITKILGDDGIMMEMFFAQRVILQKTKFDEVPTTLQPGVYEHLDDSGVAFLAGDYQPPAE